MALNIGGIFSFINGIKSFDFQGTLTKIGIGLALLLLTGGGAWFVYKWEVNRSNQQLAAAVAAAHAQGVAEANSATAQSTNKALTDAINKIQDMQTQTQQQLNDIQTTTEAAKSKIDSFDVKTVIVSHPEEVQKWANDTNNGLFNDIATEAKQ